MGASCLHSNQIWVHGPSPCKTPVSRWAYNAQPRGSQRRLVRRLGRSESGRPRVQASIARTRGACLAAPHVLAARAAAGQRRKPYTIAQVSPSIRSQPTACPLICPPVPVIRSPRRAHHHEPSIPQLSAPARIGGVTLAIAASGVVMRPALQLCNLTLGDDRQPAMHRLDHPMTPACGARRGSPVRAASVTRASSQGRGDAWLATALACAPPAARDRSAVSNQWRRCEPPGGGALCGC
jgi:hypothetical protein